MAAAVIGRSPEVQGTYYGALRRICGRGPMQSASAAFVSGNRRIFAASRQSVYGDSRRGSSTALAPDGFDERIWRAWAPYQGQYAISNATPPPTVGSPHRRRAAGYR